MSLEADTFIIDSREMLDRLYAYQEKLDSDSLFVFDVETDGVFETVSKLYGMGFCFNEHKAFYIPWRKPDGSSI